MKLIVGLGNPGKKYRNNRHNVGHVVADKLKAKSEKLKGVVVTKTDTFMNDSGPFVKSLVTSYKLPVTNLYIVHDDLDVPLGSYKIQQGRGPKDHKGLASINQALGSSSYWRVRVGIENRNNELGITNYGQTKTPGEQYVLQEFGENEMTILSKVIKEISDSLIHRIKSDKPEKSE